MDREDRLALHHAALENDTDAVSRALAAGADPNAQDEQAFTPLHFAAQDYALDAARLLLQAGADPNAVNRHGNTPLATAVYYSNGRGELIRMLREAGADPTLANTYGQTPVGLARLIDNYDVAQFFRDLPEGAGADG